MSRDIKSVLDRGDKLFGKRGILMTLWQEIADNFYPERADFTEERSLGEEFAGNLDTSYPLIARRDLGNSFSSMLRPTAKEWFNTSITREDKLDTEGKSWLEWATALQRRAMYDRKSNFLRATKEGDHDFATFGQTVLSVEMNLTDMRLLYRSWHLRDVAWSENSSGEIDTIYRKWKPFAVDLGQLFPDKLHPKTQEAVIKDPFKEVDVRHIVVPAMMYKNDDDKEWPERFVSLYVDVANKHVMEAVSVPTLGYIIPRFQTVSGSQYAYSPATVCALPDARLIQAMTSVLLDAGEKAVNPPMIAVQEAIRSDLSVYAGGVTWVDEKYDERMGEVLRPMTIDRSGIPLGIDMRRDTAAMINEAFYLNKLTLPQMGPEMTAYEVGQRVQEYVRQALPLFEPVEHDYNGAMCEETFTLLQRYGAFGSPYDLPESLRGQEIHFKFESPLHEAIEKQEGAKFMESAQMLQVASEVDPMVVANVDIHKAFRDVITSIKAPADWLVGEEQAAETIAQIQQKQQEQAMMEQVQQAGEVAEQVGAGGKAMEEVA